MLQNILEKNYEKIYNSIKERILKFISNKQLSINEYEDIIKIKNKFSYYDYNIIDDILQSIKNPYKI